MERGDLAARLVAGGRRGLLAGAAGTSALHAMTYLDMAVRGRPPSRLPEESMRVLSRAYGIPIPGSGARLDHRTTGLASFSSIATGSLVGLVLGMARALGLRPGALGGTLLATGAALVAGNLPMVRLGVTDPREWSAVGWAEDLVPHAAYGWVTHAALVTGEDR
jgi:hypothetical protein